MTKYLTPRVLRLTLHPMLSKIYLPYALILLFLYNYKKKKRLCGIDIVLYTYKQLLEIVLFKCL